MSIIVVCRNCLQRFKVNDKFAGKKGPCPKCKEILRVPLKEEEVKIHTAEHSEQAARGRAGELVLEPISREQTQLSWWLLGFVAILVLGAVVLALTFQGAAESTKYLLACAGVVLLTPPLAIVGYWFLRNADLESYTGLWLWIRTGICCLVYILCWAVYGFLVPEEWTDELWKWAFLGPVFGVVGATAAFACYDLDYSSGFFHFAFYVGVTALLGMLMGLPMVGG